MADTDEEEAKQWCPYCRADECDHLIASYAVCDSQFAGELAKATRAPSQELMRTLVAMLQQGTRFDGGGGLALGILLGNLWSRFGKPGAAPTEDDVPRGYLHSYWLQVGELDVEGCELVEDDCDGDFPGTAEDYLGLYAEKPAQTIKDILAFGAKDLQGLRERLAALAEPEEDDEEP